MAKASLDNVRTWYQDAVRSTVFTTFRTRAKLCYDFYDSKQWSPEEKAEIEGRGQIPTVINLLRQKIKGLSGVEITQRQRIKYQPRSTRPDDDNNADILSQLALYVQDKNDAVSIRSEVFKEGLVAGLGVQESDLYDDLPCIKKVDYREFFWDTSDFSWDMSDSRFRGQRKWYNVEDVISMFPDQAAAIRTKLGMTGNDDYPQPIPYTTQAAPNDATYVLEDPANYVDKTRGRVLVVKLEYRCKELCYEYVDSLGRLIRSFDKKDMEKSRISVDQARKMGWFGLVSRELMVYRYYTCVFIDELELYHEPDASAAKPDFNLQVMLIDRDNDGVPTGVVWHAIDAQKEYNKRRSKMMHALNTVRVVADADAVENPEELRREVARPDAVIIKRAGKELDITTNTDIAKSQFEVMQQSAQEVQTTTGIYDEMLGIQTNAVSGVAIQNRQNSGIKQQVPSFDRFRAFMQKHGELLLILIQQAFSVQQVVRITDDQGNAKNIILNQPAVDKQGNPISGKGPVNDVAVGLYDVAVMETLDVSTARQETLERVSQMLMNGVQPSPGVLMVAGFSEQQAKDLFSKFFAPQQQPGQPGQPQPGQDMPPSPGQPGPAGPSAPGPQGVPQPSPQ